MGLVRGFTLLEVLIALTVAGVAFSVLFALLSEAFGEAEEALRKSETFFELDSAVKRNALSEVETELYKLPGNLYLRVYKKEELEVFTVE